MAELQALHNKRIKFINSCWYYYYKITKSFATFRFKDSFYRYFNHRHNETWANERAIEIPVIWDFIKSAKSEGKQVLEVGNVLSNYFSVSHDILDKYERAPGVINEDISTFAPNKKYDLIVSISTLEHIGWDEEPRDNLKIFKAINNLKNMLTDKGSVIASFPLGYNNNLDCLIKENSLAFTQLVCFKRLTQSNKWREVDLKESNDARYSFPFPFANYVAFGFINNA